jgi:hypothetical protein
MEPEIRDCLITRSHHSAIVILILNNKLQRSQRDFLSKLILLLLTNKMIITRMQSVVHITLIEGFK